MSPAHLHPRVVLVLRVGFLLAVAVATYLAFRGHGDEVLAAVRSTPPMAVGVALVLVLGGLALTSVAWLRVLAGFGHRLDPTTGRAVFFVGQLGKYVPGGVWSIGAHAHLAAAHAVPARVTAATSLTFLGLNLATAALVVGAASVGGAWSSEAVPDVLGPVLLVVGVVALAPAVVSRLARVVSGRSGRLSLSLPGVLVLAVLLLLTWSAYAGAVVVVSPDPDLSQLPLAAGAFALSYSVGVAIVLAPAGVGAREVTLIALLAPVLGLGPAGAVAVLTRVLHTAGDLLAAVAAWSWARRAAGVGVPGDQGSPALLSRDLP